MGQVVIEIAAREVLCRQFRLGQVLHEAVVEECVIVALAIILIRVPQLHANIDKTLEFGQAPRNGAPIEHLGGKSAETRRGSLNVWPLTCGASLHAELNEWIADREL